MNSDKIKSLRAKYGKGLSAPVHGAGYRVQTQIEPPGAYAYATHRIEITDGPNAGQVYTIRTYGTIDMRGVDLSVFNNPQSSRGTIKEQILSYCRRRNVRAEIE